MSELRVTENGISIDEGELPAKKCWFFHRWSRWKIISQGSITLKGEPVGQYVDQQRKCLKCGKTQILTEKKILSL